MPSKQYLSQETGTVWTDSGGDKLLDLGGLAASTGIKCGAYLDLGAAPRADLYQVVFFVDGLDSGTATAGQTVDLFFIQSDDATNFDGAPTTAPGASSEGTITVDQARNALYVGSVSVFTTTEADNLMQGRFVARFTGRYVAPVVINRTGATLNGTSDDHEVRLIPIPPESQ